MKPSTIRRPALDCFASLAMTRRRAATAEWRKSPDDVRPITPYVAVVPNKPASQNPPPRNALSCRAARTSSPSSPASARRRRRLARAQPDKIGKREIARAFGIRGDDKIILKKILKELELEGEIKRSRTGLHEKGALPQIVLADIHLARPRRRTDRRARRMGRGARPGAAHRDFRAPQAARRADRPRPASATARWCASRLCTRPEGPPIPAAWSNCCRAPPSASSACSAKTRAPAAAGCRPWTRSCAKRNSSSPRPIAARRATAISSASKLLRAGASACRSPRCASGWGR